ncbi:MAG: adenylyltransferase/cytidyltransferase family protein [Burkholderiales bacterium]|jgi:rfaE bifunctional protein nucleotidyltransferase chain/domain|nr:adenylyltransferase/cytidyltransferase family protein [Burkholderiales bacterium]
MNRFDPLRKVLHADEAVARYASQPATVFTHGVFDLPHRGHIAWLAEARQLGDRLVVGISGDAAARLADIPHDRPLNPEGDRAFAVAALESVDAVVIYNEPTPIALLRRLRPSVYVKGCDDDMSKLAESALVRGWGGHALALPFVDVFSTASLMDRLRASSRVAPAQS